MALCTLAHDWARDRGGRVEALIVDHGLRSDSADEARRVARWLDRHGIGCRVITWDGDKPDSDIQTAERKAR